MMNAYAVQLHSDSVEKEALRAVKSHIPKACNGTYLIQQESVLIYFGNCLIQRRILRIPKHGRLQQEILAEKQFFSYACRDLLALRGSFLHTQTAVRCIDAGFHCYFTIFFRSRTFV